MAYNTNLDTKDYAEFFNLPVMQDWPAVTIYRGDEHVAFDHKDRLSVDTGRKTMGEFYIFTSKTGEISAIRCSSMLTAEKRPKEYRIGYKLGDTITVRGNRYKIGPAWNDNITLTAI